MFNKPQRGIPLQVIQQVLYPLTSTGSFHTSFDKIMARVALRLCAVSSLAITITRGEQSSSIMLAVISICLLLLKWCLKPLTNRILVRPLILEAG
jgi:hypothetical protein